MTHFMKIFCAFLMFLSVQCEETSTLCSKEFCKDYKECKEAHVHENCKIQNSTHSGIFLPYPGPCNCCDYCLGNLGENDECTVGEPGQSPSGAICGNSLNCVAPDPKEPYGTCELIDSTDCSKNQIDFDEKVNDGTVGHMELREICDRRGLYGQYKCVPGGICYCRDKTNKRIFGEIPYSSLASQVLNCACSLSYERTFDFFDTPLKVGEYLRCQSNGDFDTLQCINDECFCVDAVDGAPTYPGASLVNITEISNLTLPCFNYEVHKEEYYNPCEREYLDTLEAISVFIEDDKESHTVIGISLPNCQLDGYYAPVQKTKEYYYCANPEGKILENFKVDITNQELISTMNCHCARARSLITDEKPECLDNGNYNPLQCRRGFCRCVDENGNQIKRETLINDPEFDKETYCTS